MTKVLALGCFDCFHPGHLAHLKKARSLGDHLTVALTHDDYVGKGPGRPVFSWHEREAILSALRCVDGVTLHVDMGSTLRMVKPDIYVKGKEYEGSLMEEKLCEDLGIKVVFLKTDPVYSSTDIVRGALLRDRIRTDKLRDL